MIKIESLNFHQDLIPKLASFLYEEFSHLFPNETKKDFEEILKKRLNEKCLPITYVSFEKKEFVGTYSLREDDPKISSHFKPSLKKSYSPWLGSVFVLSHQRNRGYGKLLVKDAEQKIKKLNYAKLYLFTEDREEWYAKLGYSSIKRSFLENYPVAIMEKILN